MNGILTVSLNPVIDIHYFIDSFEIGKENIAMQRNVFAAGKAMNVSRGLLSVGISAEAHMLLGEENAAEYLRLASDYGVPISCITTDGFVRENLSINTSDNETRICMKNFKISPQILPLFASRIVGKLSDDMAVVFSGSLPKGISQDDFVSFVLMIKSVAKGTKIILDVPNLSCDSIKQIKPFLIKPNEAEAISLCDNSDPKEAALKICELTCCDNCVISLGKKGAAFASSNGNSGFIPAPHINVKSTVGAGDNMIAGILFSFMKEKSSLQDAIKWGISFGSASCLKSGTEPPDSKEIYRLYHEYFK